MIGVNTARPWLWWILPVFFLHSNCGVTWARSPKEETGCDVPLAQAHSHVVVRDSGRSATYHCRVGYLLAGSRDITCQNGEWSHPPPLCVGQNCPTLPYVEHAYMRMNHGRGKVAYECIPGFTLRGSSVLMCVGQVWNGTVPECIEKVTDKKEISNEVDGKYSQNARHGKSHYTWLRQADYTCADRDHPVRPPKIHHSRVITRWSMFEGEPRLYAVYRCNWGYQASHGEHQVNMYCRRGGWLGESIRCKPYVPGESSEKNKVELQGDQAPISHRDRLRIADYSCVSYDGSSVPLPKVPHGRGRMLHAVVQASPHLYAEFKCSDGYSLVGRAKMYCKNKAWTGKTPRCVKGVKTETTSVATTKASHTYSNVHANRDGPCSHNNGGCQQVCEIQNGVKKCACFSGYILGKDRHSCTPHYHQSGEQIPPLVLFREG